jgi:micrococcal nuclease
MKHLHWLVLAAALTLSAAPVLAEPGSDAPLVTVTGVVDGDTVRVQFDDGSFEPLRIIGVNTPERVDPREPAECFGLDASARTMELALFRKAVLETDVAPRDRFGRLLGYLWFQNADGNLWMLNERLAAEGYATQLTIQPNSRYADRFAAAVQSARDQSLGLWRACEAPALHSQPAPS